MAGDEAAPNKSSGVGRENHRMMLEHYSQTKCLLVSYDENPLGFF
jgi:aldehyde dehydrogenase